MMEKIQKLINQLTVSTTNGKTKWEVSDLYLLTNFNSGTIRLMNNQHDNTISIKPRNGSYVYLEGYDVKELKSKIIYKELQGEKVVEDMIRELEKM